MIRTYYLLTKPGIIMGNLITTAAGFLLASQGTINFWLFLQTMAGLGCVIASACVFNNYIDRESDKKMDRTKNRALASGLISGKRAVVFAIALGLLGIAFLAFYTNLLSVSIALAGFFIYVVMYSFWKYRTSLATLVGSLAGAVPPVVGYCAVSNRFDAGAALFFAILVLWQMPHFFSIAMYQFNDYAAAAIPVLPVIKGNRTTKIHMLLYIIAFTLTVLMLTPYGALLGILWLVLCLKGFKAKSDKQWARQMFRLSLVIITILSIVISLHGLY